MTDRQAIKLACIAGKLRGTQHALKEFRKTAQDMEAKYESPYTKGYFAGKADALAATIKSLQPVLEQIESLRKEVSNEQQQAAPTK